MKHGIRFLASSAFKRLGIVAFSGLAGLLLASALPRTWALADRTTTTELASEPGPAAPGAGPAASDAASGDAASDDAASGDAASGDAEAAARAALAQLEERLATLERQQAAVEAAIGEVRHLRKESEALLAIARNAALELERGQLGVRKEVDLGSTRLGEQHEVHRAQLRDEAAKQLRALQAQAEELAAVTAAAEKARAALRADLKAILDKLGD